MVQQKRIESFEDLKCWKACRELRRYVIKVISKFPNEEKYALADGMRRAARSTTENIAEGFGRYHFGENIQFCRISRGSLYEVKDQFIAAHDDNYINIDEYAKGIQLVNDALKLLNGYINYLQKAKSNISRSNNTMKDENSNYMMINSEIDI